MNIAADVIGIIAMLAMGWLMQEAAFLDLTERRKRQLPRKLELVLRGFVMVFWVPLITLMTILSATLGIEWI